MDDRYLYAGLIRLHLLHHAVKEPIYGLAMIEELGRHCYKLSAGTLYPILHDLEEKGYLTSTEERTGSAARRVYRATPAGVEALAAAKQRPNSRCANYSASCSRTAATRETRANWEQSLMYWAPPLRTQLLPQSPEWRRRVGTSRILACLGLLVILADHCALQALASSATTRSCKSSKSDA